MHQRVLIVGTIPYNPNTSSRAFDAYFHKWEKENIRQIFSNPKTPTKGHCGSLYQITDARMLKRRFGKVKETGIIFNYDDCVDDWANSGDLEVGCSFFSKLYKLGSNKSPFNYLMRKWLWKKKYWNTQKLRDWLDEFKPECVFLAFSDDFFINEIALFVADRFNIPIMTCIGDDYYFNDEFSLSLFYHIYRKKYKKLLDEVFDHNCSAIYISDKIRDKYNEHFSIKGETIYLTSDIKRHAFIPINVDNPRITYCGNIRLGRNKSLADIGTALYEINPNYKLEVYSGERSNKYIKPLKKCKGVEYKGSVPYSEVIKIFNESDIVVIVEGFKKKDVNITRYSLSTKAADSIASGCNIFTYGSIECGVIEYMQSTKTSAICYEKGELKKILKKFIDGVEMQKSLYKNSETVLFEHHNIERSNQISERLFATLVEEHNEKLRNSN